ncbi:Uncharacterized conserved protein YcbK, DUF882 family [Tranquillimonas alkanivorans]|uniref:Murein endopeptidase K n=2 Tax=Tranquillimonas alkanivorans TaxID=441119 RepID=A0A1I5TSM6_9RHOB|nr:Uncharacterized conserved protein YcbK, DUF882 family [Tranquillimonas alkanivorans]
MGGSLSGEYDAGAGEYDFSGVTLGGEGERRLVLRNAHTGETYDETYMVDGQVVPEAVTAFNNFARDWRTGAVRSMDPGLIDLLWQVWRRLDTTEPFTALSLYRSPQSNEDVGGAKNSQHLHGRACDITHSSRSVDKIHSAAKSLRAGGVGKYTMNRFVHVDTARVRYWGS